MSDRVSDPMMVLHYAVRHRLAGTEEPYGFWYWSDPPGTHGGRFQDPTEALTHHDRIHGERWDRHVVAVGWQHITQPSVARAPERKTGGEHGR